MQVGVKSHGLKALESDFREIPVRLVRGGRKVIVENVREGGQSARRIAKWTAGRHGRWYPKAITWDRSISRTGEGASMSASYGPDSSLPQGGMSFEEGSRNQKPHHDLANSLDLQRAKFHRDAGAMVDDLFRPGGHQ